MVPNLFGELILIALTAGFAWLAWRALHSRRPMLKWSGLVLAAVPALMLGLFSAVTGLGLVKLYMPVNAPVPDLKVAGSREQIARGEHLAADLCASCHSPNGELPLVGGLDLAKESPLPIGSIVSRNLTPGGELGEWTDGEIARALRNGAHRNGRPLLMPSSRLRNLSDDDLQALIAYLRSQPAVQNQMPQTSPGLLLASFVGAGLVQTASDLPPIQGRVVAPPKAPSVQYGAYLVSLHDCQDCHDANLQGRPSAGLYPESPPVLPYIRAWTQDEFIRTMRTGVDPNGYVVRGAMATQIRHLGKLDDIELAAMYQFLLSLK